jgi:hypothetical protein
MENYFQEQKKAAQNFAYKYFHTLIANPIDSSLRDLNLLSKTYAFTYHLQDNPHDIDVTRELAGDLIEAVFWTIGNTGVPNLMRAADLVITNKPPIGTTEFFQASKFIMKLAREKDVIQRFVFMNPLYEEVNKMVVSIFSYSRIKDFCHFVELFVEMRKFWPHLKSQRTEAIRRRPLFKKQIESISLFPLHYEPQNFCSTLKPLLEKHNISINQRLYTWNGIRYKIEQLANVMIIYDKKSFKQAVKIIATHTNCNPMDLCVSNYYTLATCVMNSVRPPTYQQAWLSAVGVKPHQRGLMYFLNDLDDYCTIAVGEKPPAKARKRRPATIGNLKTEEEHEVIIPDLPTLMGTDTVSVNSMDDPVITIEDDSPEEPATPARGGHDMPLLRQVLTRKISKAQPKKKSTVKWTIPDYTLMATTSTCTSPASASTSSIGSNSPTTSYNTTPPGISEWTSSSTVDNVKVSFENFCIKQQFKANQRFNYLKQNYFQSKIIKMRALKLIFVIFE